MGLRDKYKKNDKPEFQPLDLNEMNVQAIFKRCLTTNNSPKPGEDYNSVIFGRDGGYAEDHQPVCFNIKQLRANDETIRFLFGQLQAIHQGKKQFSVEDSILKYNGTNWTSNKGIMMELLYLGEASATITPFIAKTGKANVALVKPTLSPKDPKFAEWYKGYEAEMKKAEGPTPDEK